METQLALEKFNALYQGSSTEEPQRCSEEVFQQLINTALYEGMEPDRLTEAVEAADVVLTLTYGEDEEE